MTVSKAVVDVLAATPLQEGLLALHRLSSGADPYHVQFVFRIDGNLDEALLARCADAMLVRYPNLRVAFYDKNVEHPVQVVPASAKLDWEVVPMTATSAPDAATDTDTRDAQAAEFAASDFSEPFDLFRPAPLRLRLLRWNSHCHHLVLTAHHILIDGWSAPLFFAELINLYRHGGHAELLPPPPDYRKYIAWLQQKSKEESLQVWRTALGEQPAPCLVAPQAPSSPGLPPVVFEAQLDREQTEQLQTWCRKHGVTVSNTVLFAWMVVLGTLTDRDEVFTGTVVSGRPADLPGAESMIGLFINTVPARATLNPREDAATQVQALRDTLVATRPHEHIGLSDIQRAAGTRDLFDTLVVFQNTPLGAATTDDNSGFKVTPLATNDSTHYPLTIVPALVDGVFRVKVEARADLMDGTLPAAASAIASAITTLLRTFPTADGLPLAQVGNGFSAPTIPYAPTAEPRTLPQRMRNLADANPDAPALADATTQLTRRDLLAHILDIARLLIDAQLTTGRRVAILLPRTVSQPASLVACAWTGAVAVQLDASAPDAHNQSIIEQAGVDAVLTTGTTAAYGDVSVLTVPPIDTANAASVDKQLAQVPDASSLDAPLYMVFTSGSTGTPKGVVGTQRGLSALIAAHEQWVLPEDRQLTVGHAWSMAFDASWQPLTALFAGHAVAILDEQQQRDPQLYMEALRTHGVDMIETSPTMFSQLEPRGLLDATDEWPGLSVLGLGGEAIDPAVWSRLAARERPAVFNFYGPTETTVDAAAARLSDYTTPCIGSPLPGLKARVLDRWLRPLPAGLPGELYVSGSQVALGYSDRPDLTAGSFIATTSGERAYRTGDVVVFDPNDQALRYIGRADDQIKIRGFRVEPSQVLHGVLALPGVRDARVQVVTTDAGPRLIAVVIPVEDVLAGAVDDPAGTSARLIGQLRSAVASHLVPAAIIPVREFPLTRNGKIDVAALPSITADAVVTPPEGPVETQLAATISQLTGVQAIDRDADIRDLGLDSILLMQLSSDLQSLEDAHPALKRLTPRMILGNPTVRGIAEQLTAADSVNAAPDSGVGTFRAMPVQQWLIDVGGGRRFSQWALLNLPQGTDRTHIEQAIGRLLSNHGMLRATVNANDGTFTIPAEVPPAEEWLSVEEAAGNDIDVLRQTAESAINLINPMAGRMLRAVWLKPQQQLLLLVHHHAVDGTSWRVLIGELMSATGGSETTSFARWAGLMERRREALDTQALRDAWADYVEPRDRSTLGSRAVDPAVDLAADAHTATSLTPATEVLQRADEAGSGTGGSVSLREVLLAMLARTLHRWRGVGPVVVDLEGHGRDANILDAYGHPGDDLSRTAGWFTTITPTLLPADMGDESIGAMAGRVADSIAAQPSSPVDHSLACGVSNGPAEIEVNYLGRLDAGAGGISADSIPNDAWSISTDRAVYEALPEMPDPELPRTYALEVTLSVVPGEAGSGTEEASGPQLSAHFNLATGVFTPDDAEALRACWEEVVEGVVTP